VTLDKVIEADEIERKVDRAARRGLLRRYHGIDWISDAVTKKIITEEEGHRLSEVEALTARVIAVDDFDPDEVRPNYMTAGHNIAAMANSADGQRHLRSGG
jgi:acyl-CoA dehydrogenase